MKLGNSLFHARKKRVDAGGGRRQTGGKPPDHLQMGEPQTEGSHMTRWYSLLHLMVDGVCAFAMFGSFLTSQNQPMDFFAVQLLRLCTANAAWRSAGLQSAQSQKHRALSCGSPRCPVHPPRHNHPSGCATGDGQLTLFHIGGGVGTIYEDNEAALVRQRTRHLCRTGALGLYLRNTRSQNGIAKYCLWAVCILMLACCAAAFKQASKPHTAAAQTSIADNPQQPKIAGILPLCCLLVVLLRSYLGMTVTFSWKTSMLGGLAAVPQLLSSEKPPAVFWLRGTAL